jgi:DNA-binding NarL/FixJ family response regulator
MRVLLGDDSVLMLERLKEMLDVYVQADIVGAVKNGTDTLAALRTLKPDLAIIDLVMPGLSGLEVLHQIRKEDKNVKVIILTFYSADCYKRKAMQAGADYFFSKVDDFDKVSKVVADMLCVKENNSLIAS